MQKDSSPLVPLHWIGFGYAALVASGGITGYAKAGSVPSLAAGLLFGGLAGLGAYQLSQDQRNIWGFLATSGTLAGIMGMRIPQRLGRPFETGRVAGHREGHDARRGLTGRAAARKRFPRAPAPPPAPRPQARGACAAGRSRGPAPAVLLQGGRRRRQPARVREAPPWLSGRVLGRGQVAGC
uniref:Transmembrane protein 14C n=1 Tax=Equus asinus asinus TaxID=83772 RepID=A0A8C4LBD1_EQUAS